MTEEKRVELLKKLKEIREQKMEAVKEQDFLKACDCRDREKDLLDMIETQDESTGS